MLLSLQITPCSRSSGSTRTSTYSAQREYKVGQYSVDLRSFEEIALPVLQPVVCIFVKFWFKYL